MVYQTWVACSCFLVAFDSSRWTQYTNTYELKLDRSIPLLEVDRPSVLAARFATFSSAEPHVKICGSYLSHGTEVISTSSRISSRLLSRKPSIYTTQTSPSSKTIMLTIVMDDTIEAATHLPRATSRIQGEFGRFGLPTQPQRPLAYRSNTSNNNQHMRRLHCGHEKWVINALARS